MLSPERVSTKNFQKFDSIAEQKIDKRPRKHRFKNNFIYIPPTEAASFDVSEELDTSIGLPLPRPRPRPRPLLAKNETTSTWKVLILLTNTTVTGLSCFYKKAFYARQLQF